jgi:hypothetical protein
MPIIAPKYIPLWNREIILILSMIILSLLSIFIVLKETQCVQPSLILQNALQNMHENYGMLGVQIMEEGDGYVLSFNGRKLGEKTVSGKLVEYELEVYLNGNGDLYIRDLIDGSWKHAADLDLETLKEFLNMPFGLLEQSQDKFNEAQFVGDNETEHVIMLHLPPEQFVSHLASSEESRMDCMLFIEEESLFIHQISFYIYGNRDNKEIFKRTFYFNCMQDQKKKKTGETETRIAAGD